MINPEHGANPDDSHWLEALHDVIASDAAEIKFDSTLDDSSAAELKQLEECLRLLEQFRRNKDAVGRPPRRIGRFEIIREVGRGGFGVVFAAIDSQVGRQVAVKIPRPEVISSRSARSRFLREAKAAGLLTHPNLIPIHEVGEDGPICYIASALCSGPNLAQWLEARTEPVPERQAATIVASLARGVEHAHRRGVLHRDIKPSNVLLQIDGSVTLPDEGSGAEPNLTPLLTDFGLAKVAELGEDQTHNGTLVGTPAYMAPEQANGQLEEIGPTTDVYALGVLLFELIAGRPPFRGQTDVRTLQLVARGEVPPLRRFRPRVSRDIEAIAFKCLEQKPANRYPTAEHLADDLQRFLNGESTWARPTIGAEKLAKWCRRRPAVAALLSVILATSVLLMGGGWWYSSQLRAALDLVELQMFTTEQYLYAANVRLADQAISTDQIDQARVHLSRAISLTGEAGQRSFGWQYLWNELNEHERAIRGHTGEVFCVRFSPDGRLLATSSQDQTARIWDVANGKCRFVFNGHVGDVNCVAFSRTGDLLGTAGDDGTIRVWSTADGRLVSRAKLHDARAVGVAFSPVGDTLACCGLNGKVALFKAETGELVTRFVGHSGTVHALQFSSDGKILATASDDKTVRLWDVTTGTERSQLRHDGGVNCLSLSHNGDLLLTGQCSQRFVNLWGSRGGPIDEISTKVRRQAVRTYDWVQAVEFHPAGEYYAVAAKDGTVKLYRSSDDTFLRQLRGHGTRVWSLAFSRDGEYLATASADRTVKLWKLPLPTRPETIDDRSAVTALDLTRDRQTLARGNALGEIAILDVRSRKPIWTICLKDESNAQSAQRSVPTPSSGDAERLDELHDTRRVQSLAISPDGNFVAASQFDDANVKVWDARSRQRIAVWRSESPAVAALAFSPDGKKLVAGGTRGELVTYNVHEFEPLMHVQAYEDRLMALAYAPREPILATIGDAARFKIWDAQGNHLKTFGDVCTDEMRCLAFSPDGMLLAVGGNNRIAQIWEWKKGRKIASLAGHKLEVTGVAFSSDQRCLATVSSDGCVRLWNLATREELFTLAQDLGSLTAVTFAGNELLATGSRAALHGTFGTMHFWTVGQSSH